jgi:hypothetical protein
MSRSINGVAAIVALVATCFSVTGPASASASGPVVTRAALERRPAAPGLVDHRLKVAFTHQGCVKATFSGNRLST